MGNTRLKTISVKVPRSLDARISRIASGSGKTRSHVIREALENYAASSGPSVDELARRFCGILDGPADLSTGRRHLKGYGR